MMSTTHLERIKDDKLKYSINVPLQFTQFLSVQEKLIFPSSDLQKMFGRSSSLYKCQEILKGLGTSIIKICMGLEGCMNDMNIP